jgi:hypothetical protein
MAIVWKWGLNWNANALVWSNWTATNVTWVDWKSNWAGSFNGSSSSISIVISNIWTSDSISIWLIHKPSNVTSWYIFNKQANTIWHFNLGLLWNAWKLEATISLQNVSWQSFLSNSTFNIWQILNIEFIYNWSILSLYVNWVLEWTLTRTFWAWTSTATFLLWKLYNNTVYLNWFIDELEIHNTSLTPAKAKNKYLFYNWFI